MLINRVVSSSSLPSLALTLFLIPLHIYRLQSSIEATRDGGAGKQHARPEQANKNTDAQPTMNNTYWRAASHTLFQILNALS